MLDVECVVGLMGMCQDQAALLVELTDAHAASAFKPYCTDILLISERMALVRTEVSYVTWSQLLSDWSRNSPSSTPLKLKWRPSVQGGRPWAQPDLIPQQMQAVKAQSKVRLQSRLPGSKPSDMDTNIQIHGSLGPEPHKLLRDVMASIVHQLGGSIQEVREQVLDSPGDWAILIRPGTDEPSGSIRIRLGSIQDAKTQACS